MTHLLNRLFRLLKSGYLCKRSIRQCLQHDEHSISQKLAKYYDAKFHALRKDGTLTFAQVEALIDQIQVERIENQDSLDAQLLLNNIFSFLTELKPFIRENMA